MCRFWAEKIRRTDANDINHFTNHQMRQFDIMKISVTEWLKSERLYNVEIYDNYGEVHPWPQLVPPTIP